MGDKYSDVECPIKKIAATLHARTSAARHGAVNRSGSRRDFIRVPTTSGTSARYIARFRENETTTVIAVVLRNPFLSSPEMVFIFPNIEKSEKDEFNFYSSPPCEHAVRRSAR